MRHTRRSDRPDAARLSLGSALEILESRELLTATSTNHPFSPWAPSDLAVYTAISHQPLPFSVQGLSAQARQNPQAQFINNEGKVVSGEDRQGNHWTITVHGPGAVIVTDTTPNDGALDDSINTIQLIGTNPNTTYVTGQTTASYNTPTDGTVLFEKLIDTSGVKSIILNGFTLTQTIAPPAGVPNFTDTGISLTGGVGLLQFHDILASTDTSTTNVPINIVIGDPSTALTVKPTIRLDSIFNTVFSSTATSVPTSPQTTGTVDITVNGVLQNLDIVSSTQHPVVDAAQVDRGTPVSGETTTSQRYSNPTLSPVASAGNEYQFPIVGTTGRTSVRAVAINHINASGSLVNVTASRGATPFQNGSGLTHVGTVKVKSNADALGIDVNGPIKKIELDRGLGNPAGSSTAATELGLPAGQTGYPASGLQGGLITANHIGKVKINAANVTLQTSTNPEFVQQNTIGNPTYYVQPGNAMTSSTIASAGSIGKTHVVGNLQNSEIKAGYHYPSHAAGLEGTRAKSSIGPVTNKGDLVNGDITATVRPKNNNYNIATNTNGPGLIGGKARSHLYNSGGVTPLGNTGSGYYARYKAGGYQPPPSLPTRVDSRLVR